MKVTDVCVQKNCKHRVSVFVDNEYAFSLDETDAVLMKIKPGRELTQADVERCIMECNYTRARDAAFDILSRKPLCRKELEEKLTQKGYDQAVVTEVCHEMERLGYINDYDYAALFLEHCINKMWGKQKIRYEMKQKGIAPEVVDEVLSEVDDEDSTDGMVSLILTKYAGEDLKDMKTKARITRYFASRGFEFSKIDAAVRRAIEEADDE